MKIGHYENHFLPEKGESFSWRDTQGKEPSKPDLAAMQLCAEFHATVRNLGNGRFQAQVAPDYQIPDAAKAIYQGDCSANVEEGYLKISLSRKRLASLNEPVNVPMAR